MAGLLVLGTSEKYAPISTTMQAKTYRQVML